MICAPSNAALDEIITRIVKFGLLDENGLFKTNFLNLFRNVTMPKLLRIGILDRNPSVLIRSFSLE